MKTLKEQVVHSLSDGMSKNSGKEMLSVEEKDCSILDVRRCCCRSTVPCRMHFNLVIESEGKMVGTEMEMFGEIRVRIFSIDWISSPLIYLINSPTAIPR